MADDQRVATRVHRRLILRAAISGDKPLRWSHVTIQNFSSSGVFFTFEKTVAIDTLLHFKIDFPGRIVECMGRVRRVMGEGAIRGVGASFEGVHPTDQEFIDEFVEKSRPQ